MKTDRDIRRIWRQIARGLGTLERGDRRAHLEELRIKLFPFLPAYHDPDQPRTLAQILEEENAGVEPADLETDVRAIAPDEFLDAWDPLFNFVIAVNAKTPGLPARVLWDTVADLGGLPEDRSLLEDWITISEGLERGIIETLPRRYARETFDPPPLANPPDILKPDTALAQASPDYGEPIPVNSCGFHDVLKLNDVVIIGAKLPACLGGGIPISLSAKIIPDAKDRGAGYAGGDIPAGLMPYLFAGEEFSGSGLEKIERAFLLPGAGLPDNHFHGIIDSLPALRHYLDEGLNCPIVIPKLGRGIQSLLPMLLQHYDIPEDRIWSQDKASGYRFAEAILPPRHGHGRDLPEFYRPLVEKVVSETDQGRVPSRIYLKRGRHGKRALFNEPDIEKVMERFGFRVLEIWKLPMKEQIAHLALADVIAGPFGAGLANLVFAKEGARVIEILNHKNFEKLGMPYKRISDACGLEHFCVVPDSLFKSRGLTPGRITISLQRLDELLKRLAPPRDFRSRYRVWKHDLAKARRN